MYFKYSYDLFSIQYNLDNSTKMELDCCCIMQNYGLPRVLLIQYVEIQIQSTLYHIAKHFLLHLGEITLVLPCQITKGVGLSNVISSKIVLYFVGKDFNVADWKQR